MTWLRVLLARAKGLFFREQRDRQLNEELQSHLEMMAEDQRSNVSAPEAHRQALIRFGGIAQTEEAYRQTRGIHFMETLLQDLRYALRMLRRNPGFAAVVVASLALGIGANTAIFSAIDAVMLRMLPVQDPQQLVMLEWHAKEWPDKLVQDLEGSSFQDEATGISTSYSFNYPTYQQMRDQNHVFASTFAFAANSDEVNIGVDGRAEVATVQAVSWNYFEGLRVPAVVGRTFLPEDDQDSAPPVTIISYRFWQGRLGGSSNVVGKTVTMNGGPLTIVGVTPPEFLGIDPAEGPDFFTPMHQYSAEAMRQGNFNNGVPFIKDSKTWWVGVVGRLKPGVTEAQAQSEMAVLFHQAAYAGATVPSDPSVPALDVAPMKHGLNGLRRKFSTPLLLLMSMVGLVLLIACGNVASLLLTRATARQREIAVRLSLGARRFRLIRQLLTESVLLALIGGACGLLTAKLAASLLLALLSSGRNPLYVELHLDATVLAYAAVASLLSGIVFGLVPALRATKPDLIVALKQTGQGTAGHKITAGKLLVGGQVALCLVLLVSAGLMLRTLQKLKGLEIGFDRQNLLLFTLRPGLNGYQGDRLAGYYQELKRRTETIPGVRSVSFSDRGPLGSGAAITNGVITGDTSPGKRVDIWKHIIGPNYFETLGITLLLGRGITEQDSGPAHPVVVVNETFVRKYFHGDNPVGRKIDFGIPKLPALTEVVGVVRDVKYAQLRAEAPPTAYFSYLQPRNMRNFMTFEVRSSGDPAPVLSAVRLQAQALDKDVPLVNVKTETEVISEVLFLERTFAALSGAFGCLAVLLACVGLYGTMAYTVARRTNEIGIRMALGAERGNILRMVLRETLLIVIGGVVVGLPVAWAATRTLKSQLYELSPHDPATIAVALAAIVVVSAIAGYLPARRAAKVDPMVALRYE